MIALVGESASGKSTIERKLCKLYGYKRAIIYTTRPIRKGEIDGKDYHFISEKKFQRIKDNGLFAECTKYRDWQYGTLKKDCGRNKIVVVCPNGLVQLKHRYGSQLISFYLEVSERERLIRLAKRGDEILECFRRLISDQGVFQSIKEFCDYTIYCDGHKPESIARTVHKLVVERR